MKAGYHRDNLKIGLAENIAKLRLEPSLNNHMNICEGNQPTATFLLSHRETA